MPRPCKKRRICAQPRNMGLIPLQNNAPDQPVTMTVDEFEAIRLIDLEGLNQEACAERMDIARTTAQAIYNRARKKLASCLVEGKTLQVQGGNVMLCDRCGKGCRGRCPRGCAKEQPACPRACPKEELS